MLDILRSTPDLTIEIVADLKTPPDREMLGTPYRCAEMTREGLRTRNTDVEYRVLMRADDTTILDAMVPDLVMIERPLVQTENGVRHCRLPECVSENL